jgi:hypothetical protein
MAMSGVICRSVDITSGSASTWMHFPVRYRSEASAVSAKCVLVGGIHPSEKYESQLGLLFPIHGKIENVPNHQPVFVFRCHVLYSKGYQIDEHC